MVEQVLLNIIITAGKYSLLAVGFSLIYGVAKILNLTHTAYYMLAAYIIYFLHMNLQVPLILSYVISVGTVVIIGTMAYKLLIEPVREKFTTVLIITLTMAIMVQEAVSITFGGTYRTLSKTLEGSFSMGGMQISDQYLLTLFIVCLVFICIWVLLYKTQMGIAIRAMAQDREVANLMGMPEARIATITVAISIGLAAVAGAVVAPLYVMDPIMWMHPMVVVMAAVVLGGFGSIKGSVIGAFILACAEVLLVFLFSELAFLRAAFSMLVLVGALMIRPEGLFGVFLEGER